MKALFFFVGILSALTGMSQTLTDGEYYIKVKDTGKFLAIAGANKSNGAWLVQWDNEYKTHFSFILTHLGNNVYTLKSKYTGKYLSTEGNADPGAKLIQWDWLNQDNQKWYILPAPNGAKGFVLSCFKNGLRANLQHWNSSVTPGNGAYFFLQRDMNMRLMILDFKKNEIERTDVAPKSKIHTKPLGTIRKSGSQAPNVKPIQ